MQHFTLNANEICQLDDFKNTNPDFQHHRIDDATDDRDEVEHVPGIFEKVLRSIQSNTPIQIQQKKKHTDTQFTY